jgi:lipoprotein-releasing system ATP-binding protein
MGLAVQNVSKTYLTQQEPLSVLRAVSLSVEQGETIAILGPSGSGKSTLLQIIGTLDRPTEGLVKINGTDPFKLNANDLAKFRSANIGFVFQDHHLLPQCSAIENVVIAQLAAGNVSAEHMKEAEGLLQRVGLGPRISHLPGELSGGERQRVAIARALLNKPQLILADEPTGNLDAKTGRTILDTLLGLHRSRQQTMLLVTHDPNVAALADRTVHLEEGRIKGR